MTGWPFLYHFPPWTPLSSAANMRSVHTEASTQLQSRFRASAPCLANHSGTDDASPVLCLTTDLPHPPSCPPSLCVAYAPHALPWRQARVRSTLGHLRCRVGGGALTRWPPSAAQTGRAVFPHPAFTKTPSSERQSKESIRPSSPAPTRRKASQWGALATPRNANA